MRFKFTLLLLVGVLAVFSIAGCGKDTERQTASILTDDDLEMLADFDDSWGSAQTVVEVIPAPPPPEAVVSKLPVVAEVPITTAAETTAASAAASAALSVSTGSEASLSASERESIKDSYDKKVQYALKRAGYYSGAIDGKIGPMTRKAIKSFQSENGLKSDGVAGARTWEKLKGFYYSAAE